ncbi:DUF6766 family protein [Saccharothrix algeriensis]|uniref:Secreted protein n=1 Tax=Saccharothrix algeriensis TaxID=173560 RepID=A0A8T8HWM3_9PSEU|nr:DUF6766 family protein [Saccharothrix algeriensis]MBM7814609.1 hypothetical protein [Saccharothrix algeriensis]QTR02898.1 hypothetical protein J7S33_28475 [Saccharothrix algeriensis]
MKRFLRDNGLGLFFGLLFPASLVGQAFAGNADLNERRLTDGGDPIGLGAYVLSSDFAVDVAENWQSEFLAIGSMVVFSVYLRRRGSSQSKPVGSPHTDTDENG